MVADLPDPGCRNRKLSAASSAPRLYPSGSLVKHHGALGNRILGPLDLEVGMLRCRSLQGGWRPKVVFRTSGSDIFPNSPRAWNRTSTRTHNLMITSALDVKRTGNDGIPNGDSLKGRGSRSQGCRKAGGCPPVGVWGGGLEKLPAGWLRKTGRATLDRADAFRYKIIVQKAAVFERRLKV